MKIYHNSFFAGVVVLCGFHTNGLAQSIQESEAVVEDSTVVISVTRSGDHEGRTVVLVPGLASSADVWIETVDTLQEYDLRIVQVAGFAGATKFETDGDYTDSVAEAINNHLVVVPGVSPVVVGHSLGGFVALKAALIDGTPIEELVIVDSLPFLAEAFMPGATPDQAAQSAPRFAQQMASMPREDFDRQQVAGLSRLVKDKEYQETLAQWATASDQSTVATAIGELLAADLRDDIAEVKADVLVLAAHDKVMGISTEQIREMYSSQYASVPNHQIVVVEESLHFIMVDQTDLFLESLRKVLVD